MSADDGDNSPSGNDTRAGNEAIYRSPPGRFIVTPETPLGNIDRDRDTAVRLWGQFGLPLEQDKPLKPKNANNASPRRTSLDQRIDRGKRGVRKGNMLANRRFHSSIMSRVGNDAEIDKIVNTVARIDRGRFRNLELTPDNVITFLLLAKRQLLISKSVGGRNERDFLKALIRQIDRTSKMLQMLSGHPTLGGIFDDVLAKQVVCSLYDAKINILFEVEESKQSAMKKLLYFGSSSEISSIFVQFIAISAKGILNDIEGTGKVVEYAQYKFVDDLAQIWLAYTGKMPETERWSPSTADDGSASINEFAKLVHVLEPEITAEIIRTVVDAFKNEQEKDASKV